MDTIRVGATPEEWDHFAALGITSDMISVVSNTKAKISSRSNLKELGKVPSKYYQGHEAGGIKEWPQHKATPALIDQWKKEPDYGISIITRLVRAFDVDIADPDGAARVRDAIGAVVGHLPQRTRDNSGKLLLAFKCAGELPKRVIRTADGIVELLGTGQQFIAAGTHTSGARYEWVGGLPQSLPVLTLEQVNTVWAVLGQAYAVEASVTDKASTRNDVRNAAIVNDPVAQYLLHKTDRVREIDLKTGTMLIRCPNDAEHTGDSGNTETIYYPPNTGGFTYAGFKCMHAHCQHITNSMFKSMIGYTDDEALAAFDNVVDIKTGEAVNPAYAENTPTPTNPYPWQSFADYLKRPQASWHIKNVLPVADLVLIYGASGSGKSFFALDLAFAIDRGDLWHRHAVKKGRVAYVVAEGSGSFRNRLAAYTLEQQIDPADIKIVFLPAAPNLMNIDTAKALAVSLNALGRFDVIIIDTFAQVTPGANENSGDDMGTALMHCRGIRKMTGATIVLIHHAGKDASKGARGWSGTHAAADCVIEVVRNEDRRCATIVKQKDGQDGVDYSFRLDPVVVAHDEDGEAITSCVLRYTDEIRPPQEKTIKPKANQQAILVTMQDLMLVYDGFEADELIELAKPKIPKGSVDRRREFLRTAINSLMDGGRIVSRDGKLFLIGETR